MRMFMCQRAAGLLREEREGTVVASVTCVIESRRLWRVECAGCVVVSLTICYALRRCHKGRVLQKCAMGDAEYIQWVIDLRAAVFNVDAHSIHHSLTCVPFVILRAF